MECNTLYSTTPAVDNETLRPCEDDFVSTSCITIAVSTDPLDPPTSINFPILQIQNGDDLGSFFVHLEETLYSLRKRIILLENRLTNL